MMDGYQIKPIDYKTAMRVVTANHYLHRVCPCSKAFAIVDENNDIHGCVTYGVPASSTLLKGVCGEEEMHNVYELNRLWIHRDMPRNAASWLVGNTLRQLDKEIVVSYADTSKGHVGYVYQATNFIYCGLSARFLDPIVEGMEGKHHATYAHGMTKEQTIEAYGADKVRYVERARKHRYVYFNAKGKRRKELLSKLRYQTEPYPKGTACAAEILESETIFHYQEQLSLF